MAGAKNKSKRKSQSDKTAKGQPAKEYVLMTTGELLAREQKYINRINANNVCIGYINDAILKVDDMKEARLSLAKWLTYLLCDGLPKPYLPPEVRLFFAKLRFFEDENVIKTIDWVLAVNERSILTQNIFRKDKTRNYLLQDIRPEFGIEYERDVDLALKVLRSLEYYLDDDTMTVKAGGGKLVEIIKRKAAVQQEIRNMLDRYTYRVLCSENSYMSPITPLTAEYTYMAKHFAIHLWTIKNVPIRFEHLESTQMVADLHALNVKVQIPYSLLAHNLTLRGMHLYYDHYSDSGSSLEQKVDAPDDSSYAGITNLNDCLINEWGMQVDLQQEVRNKMVLRRLEFEEHKLLAGEEAAKPSKDKKNTGKASKTKKPPKGPKEPPIITDDMYPDIWDDFLELEQNQFVDYINALYNPKMLKLGKHEINMRKYFILGGIYELYFVEKPRHFDFATFNMTWHENDSQLQIHRDICIEDMTYRRQSSMRFARVSRLSVLSDIALPVSTAPVEWDVEKTTLFVLSIALPPHLCLWGEPQPCHYEEDTIIVADVPQQQQQQKEQAKPVETHELSSRQTQGSVDQSFVRASVKSGMSLLRPSGISLSIYRPSAMALGGPSDQGNDIDLEDFRLEFMLNKAQIRNMARHCLPRLISSFKFPKEVFDEADEENRNKPKGMGGTLVRKRNSFDDDVKMNERLFSYKQQNNPERLFPIFEHSEPINIPAYVNLLHDTEPETFFELVEALRVIKRAYQKSIEKTSKLPLFISKLDANHLLPKAFMTSPKAVGVEDSETRLNKVGSRKSFARSSRVIKRPSTMPSSDNEARASRRVSRRSPKTSPRSSSRRSTRMGVDQPAGASPTIIGELNVEVDSPKTHKHHKHHQPKAVDEPTLEAQSLKEIKISLWTTKHILHSTYDRQKCTFTIWTDRLGTLGFAFKRYEHFPFRDWSLQPSEENPETEVIFTLETQYVRCVLYITKDGYRGYVTEPTKKFVRNRAMYLTIEQPLTDFKELKRIFRDNNLNIFSNDDACFYIENGYFSEKHVATEMHTYCCMAVHSTQMIFEFSDWNRLAHRRDMVLGFVHYKEAVGGENHQLVHVTPEGATFVDIKELCSNDLDVFKLEYTLTWRNIDHYADLHQLITSIYPNSVENRVKDATLTCCIKNLLCEIRPLSFS